MWARSSGESELRSHGAAEDAVKAERGGKDPAEAAKRGANKPEVQIAPAPRMRELANWYAWAVDSQHLPSDRALDVARAAATAVVRGMSHSQAFDVALAYAQGKRVRLGPPLSTRLMRDPGCFPLGAAILVLGLALFAGLPFIVLLIAFFSFAIPLRAARFAGFFSWMMAAALVVDVAAIAVVVSGWHF
jgi:hypothetical protein